jgi:hypothetical protein
VSKFQESQEPNWIFQNASDELLTNYLGSEDGMPSEPNQGICRIGR